MEHIGESINRYFNHTGLNKQLEKQFLLNTWYNVVGTHISKHSRPVTIRNNKLIVDVKDSTWLYHLTLLKPKIINDFNFSSGEQVIDDIQFRNMDFNPVKNKGKKQTYDDKAGKKLYPYSKKSALKSDEETLIEKCVLYSPAPLQHALKSLMQHSFLHQHWKKEQGALVCSVCGFLFFKHELRENLCMLCHNTMKGWRKPIQYMLHHKPWVNKDEMSEHFPNLEPRIFQICRDTILSQYGQRIRKLFMRTDVDERIKKKALFRLAQRYVLILEEKDPSGVSQDDTAKALKSFPGLYLYLYSN